ncbi:MAG: DUF262 domain-containing protein [Niastella sp.]|nr:DUF262 domain-containing protein [Niastella sp.]
MADQLESSDDKLGVEIPKEKRYLNTASYDFSVQTLVDYMTGDIPKIILEVPFQRNFIWKDDRASQLIESVIMNVPIPPLYFAEEESGRWLVIDGLQRLNSLLHFHQNEYKLQGLEIIKELIDLKYKDLPPKSKSLLNDGLFRVNVIKKDSHPDIKYDIFMRLNKGSVSLNYQELRNCLYRGHLNDIARIFSKENKDFQKLLNLKRPHPRFLDVELIMRVFALNEKLELNDEGEYHIESYNGRMVNFINDYMDSTRKMTKEDAENKLTELGETINKVIAVFGLDQAFKDQNAKIKRFNKSIAEFILLSFQKYDIEKLKENKKVIKDLLKEHLLSNDEFRISISQNTSDKDVVNFRINYWLKTLEDAI